MGKIASGVFATGLLVIACGCSQVEGSADGGGQCLQSPSDDPADWVVDTGVEYDVVPSEPCWVVPSAGLPAGLKLLPSNNNVDIVFHCGRLYMAWRNAPNHFASEKTAMYVVSSADNGATWRFETRVAVKRDVREPRFLSFRGRLQLMFFVAGTDPFKFEPLNMSRVVMDAAGKWGAPQVMVEGAEVPWDVKVRGGRAWMTSYTGDHYVMDPQASVSVHLSRSDDGEKWERVDGKETVYKGGVSEAAFEFDAAGGLWTEMRNEDGDATGFGSMVCFAAAGALSEWACPQKSDPERYDSPEMFRHGSDIYLLGRRDVGGPYDEGRADLTFEQQKSKYLVDYSMRPKGFALYRIDPSMKAVVKEMDLPGAGDTAFASVRRTGAHTFIFANYSSPLDMKDESWMGAQFSDRGTQIYLMELKFVPKGSP